MNINIKTDKDWQPTKHTHIERRQEKTTTVTWSLYTMDPDEGVTDRGGK